MIGLSGYVLAAIGGALLMGGAASACALAPTDLSKEKAFAALGPASTRSLVDPDSSEKVLRQSVVLKSGAVLVVEQKDCSMRNLTVGLLVTGDAPSQDERAAMASALGATPLWKEGFGGGSDPARALAGIFASERYTSERARGSVSFAADDVLAARNGRVETMVTATPLKDAPWRTFVSVYVGLGGEE